jgi:hypothetical protein
MRRRCPRGGDGGRAHGAITSSRWDEARASIGKPFEVSVMVEPKIGRSHCAHVEPQVDESR